MKTSTIYILVKKLTEALASYLDLKAEAKRNFLPSV